MFDFGNMSVMVVCMNASLLMQCIVIEKPTSPFPRWYMGTLDSSHYKNIETEERGGTFPARLTNAETLSRLSMLKEYCENIDTTHGDTTSLT